MGPISYRVFQETSRWTDLENTLSTEVKGKTTNRDISPQICMKIRKGVTSR